MQALVAWVQWALLERRDVGTEVVQSLQDQENPGGDEKANRRRRRVERVEWLRGARFPPESLVG